MLQSLWIGRTTFTTVDSFPGVISWFEVLEVKEVSSIRNLRGKKNSKTKTPPQFNA